MPPFRALLLLFSLLPLLLLTASAHAQHGCDHSKQRSEMHRTHPEWMGIQNLRNQALEQHIQTYSAQSLSCTNEDIIVPIVFHVVHDNGPENISDAQIQESIVQLNEDFSATNPELSAVEPAFSGLVSDVGMVFRLADFDPNGQPTTGINRIQSNLTYNGSDIALKQLVQWDPTMYLNVWVVHSSDGGNGSAFAFYPGDVEGSASIYDGIVSSYWAVGRTETAVWTHYKILTHEVGHWANLKHTWGDQSGNQSTEGCAYDDGVEDTPNTIGNTGCDPSAVSCGSQDNVQNYMDYSNCSSMFTEGQKTRMLATMCSDVAGRNHIWSPENHAAVFLQQDVLPRIVYLDGAFEESYVNDGSIDSEIDIALLDLEFASVGPLTEGVDFTTGNLPAGTTLSVEVLDSAHATVILTGQVTAHAVADNLDNIQLHFTGVAFSNVAFADIYNPSNTSLGLTFLDPYEIVFVDLIDDAHNFFEGRRWTWFTMGSGGADFGFFHYDLVHIKLETYGNGAVCNPGTSDITPLPLGAVVGSNTTFTEPGPWYPDQLDLSNPEYTDWNGQIAYAGVRFERNGNHHYGWIRMQVSEDGRHYYALDMAYNEAPGADIAMGEVQEPVLAYTQTTFHEDSANGGSLSSERAIDLFGSTWEEFESIESGAGFDVSSIPNGLTAHLQRASDTRALLSFAGTADAHGEANGASFQLSFDPSLITDLGPDMSLSQWMSLDFADPYGIEYIEVDPNDGIMVSNPGNNWKYFTWDVGDAEFGLWFINGHFRLETYSKSGVCNAGSTNLSALQAGDTIRSESNWEYFSELETQLVITSPDYSDWNGQTTFAGVKFTIAERFHYGWMRFEVSPEGDMVRLVDYAYNSNPGEEIIAGQTYATYGCTDPLALNFSPNAIDDDGTCEYPQGCTDPAALNFDSEAVEDDGSCEYTQGCTDPTALNFDSEAVEDDGTCYYDFDVLGCTDGAALNFNPIATYDDGSCDYSDLSINDVAEAWCTGDTLWISWTGGNPAASVDLSLINVDANAAVASLGPVPNTGLHPWVVDVADTDVTYRLYVAEYPYPPSSWDYGNTFTVSDNCTPALLGCMDPLACNFNTEATDEDGSCLYGIDALGVCGGDCLADVNGDGVCDPSCPQDLDLDGMITVSDVLLMLGEFGCQTACTADINLDGIVTVEDFLFVLSEFGNSCD